MYVCVIYRGLLVCMCIIIQGTVGTQWLTTRRVCCFSVVYFSKLVVWVFTLDCNHTGEGLFVKLMMGGGGYWEPTYGAILL